MNYPIPGTNPMIIEFKVSSEKPLPLFEKAFAPNARKIGNTITNFNIVTIKQGPHDWTVSVRYDHTCKNRAKAMSDARRFADECVGRINKWLGAGGTETSCRITFEVRRAGTWRPMKEYSIESS